MINKKITFGEEAIGKMFAGVEKIASAVRVTMGPRGRNVILEKEYGPPLITNDGVTIANQVYLEDRHENMGAQLVKEAANRTNDLAGDGTSVSTVLAHAIIKEGLRVVAAGANPMVIQSGIKKAVAKVVENLRSMAKKVETTDEIKQVATISAQDEQVGTIISEMFEVLGNDGVITVEDGNTDKLEKRLTEGMSLDTGIISHYLFTDPETMESKLEDVATIVIDGKIESVNDVLNIAEFVGGQLNKKEVAIIAEDFSGDALNTMLANHVRGTFKFSLIRLPGFATRRKEIAEDISVYVGSSLVSREFGMSLDKGKITPDMFGKAKRIIATKEQTVIIGGAGEKESVENRIASIKAMINHAKDEFAVEKLTERLAALSGAIGVIEVGASTQVELKEKKLRIEDAISATRSAIQEGIVAGGGTALLKASRVLSDKDFLASLTEDELVGVKIIERALFSPTKQIADNAGVAGDVVTRDVLAEEDANMGYNAMTHKMENLLQSGIVDPVKVPRVALEHAASVASTFITTEAAVVFSDEKKADVK